MKKFANKILFFLCFLSIFIVGFTFQISASENFDNNLVFDLDISPNKLSTIVGEISSIDGKPYSNDNCGKLYDNIIYDYELETYVYRSNYDNNLGSRKTPSGSKFFSTQSIDITNGITIEMFVKLDTTFRFLTGSHSYSNNHGLFTTSTNSREYYDGSTKETRKATSNFETIFYENGKMSLQRIEYGSAYTGIGFNSSYGLDYFGTCQDCNIDDFSKMPLDKWLHVVFTEDTNGLVSLYVDGELIVSGNYGHSNIPDLIVNFAYQGSWYNEQYSNPQLEIAEAKIYSASCDGTQVKTLYTNNKEKYTLKQLDEFDSTLQFDLEIKNTYNQEINGSEFYNKLNNSKKYNVECKNCYIDEIDDKKCLTISSLNSPGYLTFKNLINNIDNVNELTIEFDLYIPYDTFEKGNIISIGDTVSIYFEGSSIYYNPGCGLELEPITKFTYDKWIHVVLTFGQGCNSFYFDGVKCKGTFGNNNINGDLILFKGYEGKTAEISMSGLKIYNRMITYCECVELSNNYSKKGFDNMFDNNKFSDVFASDYYYDAVLWAVDNNITSGLSEHKFGPNKNCTRGQIITMLWNIAGKPKVECENQFIDIKENDYFYEAVLWATNTKLTSGTTINTFSPNSICTRSQAITFLWRYNGSQNCNNTKISFNDVSSSSYYCNAIKWAVKNKITAGLSSKKFGSNSMCTRAQIISFINRSYSKN